jgi:hypothetical protein
MELPNHVETISPQQEYLRTLTTVNDMCQKAQLNPLFIGGVITKVLGLGRIERIGIDYATRTVHIPTTAAEYTSFRKDGTADDFDIIVNHPDKVHVDLTIKCIDQRLKEQGLTHHFVSIEAVRYPDWKPRNKVLQMVSGIDIDPNEQTRFTFGSTMSPPVSEESMQPWTYVMEENGTKIISLPSFGPEYIGLRYLMRLPVAGSGGLRQKDRIAKIDKETDRKTNKIHTLMTLRKKAIKIGIAQGYKPDDEAWQQFIIDLQHTKHQDSLTRAKSEFFHFYWETLGPLATAIVHGQGLFEEVAKLGNKFGG